MQSRYFTEASLAKASIEIVGKIIAKASAEDIQVLVEATARWVCTQDAREQLKIATQVLENLEVSARQEDVFDLLHVGGRLVGALAQYGDGPNEIALDVVTLCAMSDDAEKQRVVDYCLGLQSASDEDVRAGIVRTNALQSGGPRYLSAECVVDFRALTHPDRLTGTKADDYRPSLMGFVPVAMLGLRVGDTRIENFHMELDKGDVVDLIEQLRTVLIDIEMGERAIRGEATD